MTWNKIRIKGTFSFYFSCWHHLEMINMKIYLIWSRIAAMVAAARKRLNKHNLWVDSIKPACKIIFMRKCLEVEKEIERIIIKIKMFNIFYMRNGTSFSSRWFLLLAFFLDRGTCEMSVWYSNSLTFWFTLGMCGMCLLLILHKKYLFTVKITILNFMGGWCFVQPFDIFLS